MKVDLISFQEKALKELRFEIADALNSYRNRVKTQVVSLQAPTGSGKTIMMAALIESIYAGYTFPDGVAFAEQPDAIFVWLSDSPELNEQSKQKIELKTSKLRFGQCVTISDETFDMELLEDGHIYFLNTQKISRAGNLTRHSDNRHYTIWETLDNTVKEKSDRLYFIIDEAHRGAKTPREQGADTTIMQRFIRGYEYIEDGLRRKMRPMPNVVGMSATAARFNTLIGNINSTLHKCTITADEVRESGLLKDRIVITYPDDSSKNNDMVLLEAATDEWILKCRRWNLHSVEQHNARVDPVFVVQVCPGSGKVLSETNLDEVVTKIEEKTGTRFAEGEVVHCFGSTANIEINGLNVPHVNASEIADDHRIKVVLFKEALSTGWDCPRAETMMSFRHASDATYIAQLLGRMIRTPLQSRVLRDDFLNDVKLYLPYFNKATVSAVVEELQNAEGGEIPTEIDGESLGEPTFVTWTAHTEPKLKKKVGVPNQIDIDEVNMGEGIQPSFSSAREETGAAPLPIETPKKQEAESAQIDDSVVIPPQSIRTETPVFHQAIGKQLEIAAEIDREAVIQFINKKGFLTFFIRSEKINDYLKSLLDLATLLTHQGIDTEIDDQIENDVVQMIEQYIDRLHHFGKYEELAQKVLQFKLSVQVFDAFGEKLKNANLTDLYYSSETDLERQLRNAEARLGRYGFKKAYGERHYDADDPNAFKIDVILFAAEDENITALGEYAKKKFLELTNKYRLSIVNKSETCKKKYHDILADSDYVSEQIYCIPEDVVVREDKDGEEYENHLLADAKTGIAKIKLNSWEAELIKEESHRTDFLCWLRNISRGTWSLCLPYEMGGEIMRFYPDFLIVRSDPKLEYVVDILEPHGDQYTNNLPKAKALALYAKKEPRFGRIQLIRKGMNSAGKSQFLRLDLTDLAVQERVLHAVTDDELKNIFRDFGTWG